MRNRTMQIVGWILSAGFLVLGVVMALTGTEPAVLPWGFLGLGGGMLFLTLIMRLLLPLLPRDWEEKQMAAEREELERSEKESDLSKKG